MEEKKSEETSLFPRFYVTDKVGTTPVAHWRLSRPEISKENCKRCWICVEVCPEGCLIKEEGGLEVDLRFCKGCGICANECKFSAIQMLRE